VPLVFCHLDGAKNLTNKVVLYKNLEKRIVSNSPRTIEVYIIDGFFFLHLLSNNLPQTYEAIARVLLIKLCKYQGKETHLIFDQILYPSIKVFKRDRRSDNGDINAEYDVIGKKQKKACQIF
jgi:hypothetical protein